MFSFVFYFYIFLQYKKEEICKSNIKNTNNTTKIIKLIIKLKIVIMIIITKITLILIVKALLVIIITTLKNNNSYTQNKIIEVPTIPKFFVPSSRN